MMNNLGFKVFIICCILTGNVFALRISDFYQDVKVGQWILMKSGDGLLTKTSVVAKGEGKITLRIQSSQREKIISTSEQMIDIEMGRVISIRIYEGSRVKEIRPKKSEMDDFFHIEFQQVGEEYIAVEKGYFNCHLYKGIYKDRKVKAWINYEVPILHLVKISMKEGSVQLVDYGK